MIDLTQKLMQYPSVSGDLEAKKRIVEWVKGLFPPEVFRVEEYSSRGLPSVVISFKANSGQPALLLNGHLDVVPAQPKDFIPRRQDNRIYGRGSGDMKAACAVMIEVMKKWAEEKDPPDLGLMLTTDEEVGGFNGVGYLVETQGYRPELALIPDGGRDLSTLAVNEKGVLHLKIKAWGRAAHGSRPFLGENAVDKLIDIYRELRGVIPQLRDRQWQNTMNLGKIQGGEATNKVPDYAEMDLDIRFLGRQDKEDILRQVREITSDFEILAQGPPFVQDKDHDLIKDYKKTAEEVLGQELSFYRSEGASDARFFSEVGVPVISTKINCGNIHAEGEWVDIDSMERFYDITLAFVASFFRDKDLKSSK